MSGRAFAAGTVLLFTLCAVLYCAVFGGVRTVPSVDEVCIVLCCNLYSCRLYHTVLHQVCVLLYRVVPYCVVLCYHMFYGVLY